MKSNTFRDRFPTIGLSSLLVMFFALCLTTFALLALSSTKSDDHLSQKFAAHRTDYYQASSKAERILDQIDTALAEDSAQVLTQDEWIIDEIPISIDPTADRPMLSYEVPMNNRQTLSVRLEVTDPASAAQFYQIVSWKVTE